MEVNKIIEINKSLPSNVILSKKIFFLSIVLKPTGLTLILSFTKTEKWLTKTWTGAACLD